MNIHKLKSNTGNVLVVHLKTPDQSRTYPHRLGPFEIFEIKEAQITDDIKEKIKTRALSVMVIQTEDAPATVASHNSPTTVVPNPFQPVKSSKKFRKKQKN